LSEVLTVYEITVDEFAGSIFFIDLPFELNFDISLIANSAESVEDIAREKIAELTGTPSTSFAIVIDWNTV
jgi:hypothetical protein